MSRRSTVRPPLTILALLLIAACATPPETTPRDGVVRTTLSAEPASLSLIGKMDRNTEIVAFQITDDLLDYSGDPETLGKDAGQDREHTTFVSLSGIDGSRRLVDELIDTSIASLERFGRRASRLVALAEYVRNRDR